MKKIMCDCCGAALPIPNKYQRYIKCEYCDATYELDNQQILLPQYVLIEPGYIKKYAAKIIVDEEKIKYYPPKVIKHYVKEQIAHQLTEFLMNEIKIQEEYDVMNFERKYHTIIRLDTRGY